MISRRTSSLDLRCSRSSNTESYREQRKALGALASGDSLRASLRSVLASSAVGDRTSPFHSSRPATAALPFPWSRDETRSRPYGCGRTRDSGADRVARSATYRANGAAVSDAPNPGGWGIKRERVSSRERYGPWRNERARRASRRRAFELFVVSFLTPESASRAIGLLSLSLVRIANPSHPPADRPVFPVRTQPRVCDSSVRTTWRRRARDVGGLARGPSRTSTSPNASRSSTSVAAPASSPASSGMSVPEGSSASMRTPPCSKPSTRRWSGRRDSPAVPRRFVRPRGLSGAADQSPRPRRRGPGSSPASPRTRWPWSNPTTVPSRSSPPSTANLHSPDRLASATSTASRRTSRWGQRGGPARRCRPRRRLDPALRSGPADWPTVFPGGHHRAARRKATGEAIADDRAEILAGDASEADYDALRRKWRSLGRDVVEQMREEAYERTETVPFFVTVGRV